MEVLERAEKDIEGSVGDATTAGAGLQRSRPFALIVGAIANTFGYFVAAIAFLFGELKSLIRDVFAKAEYEDYGSSLITKNT